MSFVRYIEEGRKALSSYSDFDVSEYHPDARNALDEDTVWSVETAATDTISSVLHFIFGRTPVADCYGDAAALLDKALRTWEGDYEDLEDDDDAGS